MSSDRCSTVATKVVPQGEHRDGNAPIHFKLADVAIDNR